MKYYQRLLIVILMILLGSSSICLQAGTVNDVINRCRTEGDKIVKEETKNFIKLNQLSDASSKQYIQVIDNIKSNHGERFKRMRLNSFNKQTPQAMIFVSLDMPQRSLQQIIHDAARYEVPVVIRGLYRNSFRETMNKIFELVKKRNRGGILINPRWFKQYEIQSVPAVVVSQAGKYDVIYGNIPLRKALKIIAERGDVAAVAKKILEEKSL